MQFVKREPAALRRVAGRGTQVLMTSEWAENPRIHPARLINYATR